MSDGLPAYYDSWRLTSPDEDEDEESREEEDRDDDERPCQCPDCTGG